MGSYLKIIIFSIVFAISTANAGAAFRLPGWACRETLQRVDTVKFDPAKFELAQESWRRELANNSREPMIETVVRRSKGPEDLLAYVEAVTRAAGSKLFDMKEFLRTHPDRAQRFANEFKKVFESGELFTGRGTTRMIAELYSVSRFGNRPGFRRFIPLSADAAITKRILLDLERRSLEEAFARMGIFQEPGDLSQFRRWLGNNKYVTELPILAGTAALSATYLGKGVPLGGFHPLGWKRVPDEWLDLYRSGGLDAIRPLFRKEFRTLANVDYAWRIFTTAVGVAALGVITIYIATYPEMLGYAKDWVGFSLDALFANISPESMQKYSDDDFDCKRVDAPGGARERKIKSWKETYEVFEGRPLTAESDPKAWKRFEAEVLKAPCESFKVEYLP